MTASRYHDIGFLDGMRGIAAVYVMVGHSRWLLWEGFSEGYLKHVKNYSLLEKGLVYFFSLFTYGHQAVIFFFILSGFVIHLSVIKRPAEDFNFRTYLKKRFLRIYPVLTFSLVFTLILDYLGNSLFHLSIYSHQTLSTVLNTHVPFNTSMAVLGGNFFMLQNAYVPVWGTNGPLWSLMYEWWFYLLYIPLLVVYFYNKTACYLLVFSLTALGILDFFPLILANTVFRYLLCWWLGCLMADTWFFRPKLIKPILYSLGSVLIILAIAHYGGKSLFMVSEYELAVLYAGFILLLLFNPDNRIARFIQRFSFLGTFSYTLYLVHFSLLVFLSGMILKFHHNSLPQSQVMIIAGILISLSVSFLSFLLVEKRFISSSKKLQVNSSANS